MVHVRRDEPNGRRGEGSRRERRLGVWEVRVVVAVDPRTKRSRQRSWTVRGDEAHVASVQADLVAEFGLRRVAKPADATRLTICELIECFLAAPRMWSPATYRSYGSPARFLARDALGGGGPGSPDTGAGRRGDRPLDPRGVGTGRRARPVPAAAFGDHLGDARAVPAVRSARRSSRAARTAAAEASAAGARATPDRGS